MRIVLLATAKGFRGGEGQLLALAEGLRRRGHGVLLVGRRGGELVRRARAAGLDTVELPLRGGWDVASALRLAAVLRRRAATLLHAHDAHGLDLGALAGRLAGVPLVFSRRVDFPLGRLGPWRYRALPIRILAVSDRVREVLLEAGVAEDRIRVVPDGVDVDAIERAGSPRSLLDAFGLPAEAPYVGNVAALTDHKGQRYLVEAAALVAARVPEARFLIAGEGELEGALRRRIAALGLERSVHLLGFVPDVRSLYRALRVLAMPSHREGLGSAVLEAMAAGVPVVAARAGGLPEIVEDEVVGLLVPPRDPAALAHALVRLLEDPALARRLGEEGRRRVRARFTVDRMVDATLRVYEEVVAPRRRASDGSAASRREPRI